MGWIWRGAVSGESLQLAHLFPRFCLAGVFPGLELEAGILG